VGERIPLAVSDDRREKVPRRWDVFHFFFFLPFLSFLAFTLAFFAIQLGPFLSE
jgi:hypothetical protein